MGSKLRNAPETLKAYIIVVFECGSKVTCSAELSYLWGLGSVTRSKPRSAHETFQKRSSSSSAHADHQSRACAGPKSLREVAALIGRYITLNFVVMTRAG